MSTAIVPGVLPNPVVLLGPPSTGNAGQLLQAAGDGGLQWSSALQVDETNNRVGIGAAPESGYSLRLAGNLRLGNNGIIASAANTLVLAPVSDVDVQPGTNRFMIVRGTIVGSNVASGNLSLDSTISSTKGEIRFCSNKLSVDADGNISIGKQGSATGGTGLITLRSGSSKRVTLTSTDDAFDIQTFGTTPIRFQNAGGGPVQFMGAVTFNSTITTSPSVMSFEVGGASAGLQLTAVTGQPRTIQSFGSQPLSLNPAGNAIYLNQPVYGGTTAAKNLVLESTTNAIKGNVLIGSSLQVSTNALSMIADSGITTISVGTGGEAEMRLRASGGTGGFSSVGTATRLSFFTQDFARNVASFRADNGWLHLFDGNNIPPGASIQLGHLHVVQSTAGSNDQFAVLLLDAAKTTSPGAVIQCRRPSNAGLRDQFTVVTSWADSTDASRKSRVAFNIYDTAVREVMRFDTTGSQGYVSVNGQSPVTLRAPLNVKTDASGNGFLVGMSSTEYTVFQSGGVQKGFAGTGSVQLVMRNAGDVALFGHNTEAVRCTTGGQVIMPNLPTADPGVPGALWNDAGTLKVSAG